MIYRRLYSPVFLDNVRKSNFKIDRVGRTNSNYPLLIARIPSNRSYQQAGSDERSKTKPPRSKVLGYNGKIIRLIISVSRATKFAI